MDKYWQILSAGMLSNIDASSFTAPPDPDAPPGPSLLQTFLDPEVSHWIQFLQIHLWRESFLSLISCWTHRCTSSWRRTMEVWGLSVFRFLNHFAYHFLWIKAITGIEFEFDFFHAVDEVMLSSGNVFNLRFTIINIQPKRKLWTQKLSGKSCKTHLPNFW